MVALQKITLSSAKNRWDIHGPPRETVSVFSFHVRLFEKEQRDLQHIKGKGKGREDRLALNLE
jgi:hypothetical protein